LGAAMQRKILLERIWSQFIKMPESGCVSPLASILESLQPEKVVTLVQDSPLTAPYIMTEDTVLLPGVSLGDVLAEEFNVNVPKNSIVLVEPAHLANAKEYDPKEIGEVLGRILTDIVSNGQGFLDTSNPARTKFQNLVEYICDQGANIPTNGAAIKVKSTQFFGT